MHNKSKSVSDKKIVIIGSGNLATHLAKALAKKGFNLVQIYSKTLAHAKILAEEFGINYTNNLSKVLPDADIYFLCVKDDVLHSVLNKLNLKDKLLVHTSGNTPMALLKPYSKNVGVFYPLQTFTKSSKIKFKNVPILVEANSTANKTTLLNIANQLSENVTLLNSKQRKYLHLAAVFACNFTNHLYSIAEDICIENKIDFNLLKPIIKLTAKRIEEESPKNTQTGPAIRKDYKVIEVQKGLLNDNAERLEIYKVLTESIIKSTSV